MAGDDQQIERDDRAPHIAFERRQRSPSAAIQAEYSLQKRDRSLNASAKIAQTLVDPTASDHVGDLERSCFGEGDIFNALRFNRGEIGFRREAAVVCGLS